MFALFPVLCTGHKSIVDHALVTATKRIPMGNRANIVKRDYICPIVFYGSTTYTLGHSFQGILTDTCEREKKRHVNGALKL